MKIKCKIGLHKWINSRPISPIDFFPPPFIAYENPTRKCKICGKEQEWMPGYGGSELGFWLSKK